MFSDVSTQSYKNTSSAHIILDLSNVLVLENVRKLLPNFVYISSNLVQPAHKTRLCGGVKYNVDILGTSQPPPCILLGKHCTFGEAELKFEVRYLPCKSILKSFTRQIRFRSLFFKVREKEKKVRDNHKISRVNSCANN